MIELRGEIRIKAGSVLRIYIPPEDSNMLLGSNPLLLGDGIAITIGGSIWRGYLRSVTRLFDEPGAAHIEIELCDQIPVAYEAEGRASG